MQIVSDKNFKDITIDKENIFDIEFLDCVFENCKFNECILVNCTFSECKFIDCSFVGLKTKNVSILFAEFIECTIVGLNWANLDSGSISFPIGKLKNCYLKYNEFEKMNFKKFDFEKSSIVDSNFVRCNLGESNFNMCDLKNTHFAECDLRKADFREAKGYGINAFDNIIKGAKFSRAEVVSLLKYFDIIIEN